MAVPVWNAVVANQPSTPFAKYKPYIRLLYIETLPCWLASCRIIQRMSMQELLTACIGPLPCALDRN